MSNKIPFYDKYTIDTETMDCGRVIVSGCNGEHEYKSICELLEKCWSDKLKQLKNSCIVDFLNSDLKSKAGKFIKVNANWCLTTWDMDCSCEDKYVIATSWDKNPWPLYSKITGGCDPSGDYCITVGTPNPNTVQLIPSWPHNWFTSFKGAPQCSDAYVKMKQNGDVYLECPEIKKGIRYALCIHSGGSVSFPPDQTWSIYAVHWRGGNQAYKFSGNWSYLATPGFSVGKDDEVINIEESWLYLFTYQSYVHWNTPTIYSIRAGIWVNDYQLGDTKYNGTRFKSGDWHIINMNYLYPNSNANVDGSAMALDNLGLSFSGSFCLPIQWASKSKPAKLRFLVKPDTRTTDPRMVSKPNTTITLADHTQEVWPRTIITVTKLADDPAMFGMQFIS